MKYTRHDRGKHYTEITGAWPVVLFYRMTGKAIGKLEMKPIYRGLKKHGGK